MCGSEKNRLDLDVSKQYTLFVLRRDWRTFLVVFLASTLQCRHSMVNKLNIKRKMGQCHPSFWFLFWVAVTVVVFLPLFVENGTLYRVVYFSCNTCRMQPRKVLDGKHSKQFSVALFWVSKTFFVLTFLGSNFPCNTFWSWCSFKRFPLTLWFSNGSALYRQGSVLHKG